MSLAASTQLGLLLREIRELGLPVGNLSELRRLRRYRQAVPVLLKYLRKVSDDELKEDIVRTLSLPDAGPDVAHAFVEEFSRTDNFFLKWAIANGLSIVATESVLEDLIGLVQDRRHGRAREMLAVALSRFKDPDARSGACHYRFEENESRGSNR
jgi:hypothetical protein